MAPRVFVFGCGRSGTTWTAQILGATAGAQYFNEPDNVSLHNYALRALKFLDTDPVLGADDAGTPSYERLWDALLGDGPPRRIRGRNWIARRLLHDLSVDERRAAVRPGGPPPVLRHRVGLALTQPQRVDPTRPVIVKTVAALFALEWVLARWHTAPVWVRRHPLDVVASRIAVPIHDEAHELWRALCHAERVPPWCPPPPESDDQVAAAAWMAGSMMSACRDAAARHDDVVVVDHETLCVAPVVEFRDLAARLRLEWNDRAAAALAAANRPGDGWSTNRITAEQPGRWRTRLAAEEQRTAADWLAKFPVAEDYPELASIR